MAQKVKNLPVTWEIWVRSLGWEDPLEKGMATRSVLLPGESHGQRSLAGYRSWGCKESDTTEPRSLSLCTLILHMFDHLEGGMIYSSLHLTMFSDAWYREDA